MEAEEAVVVLRSWSGEEEAESLGEARCYDVDIGRYAARIAAEDILGATCWPRMVEMKERRPRPWRCNEIRQHLHLGDRASVASLSAGCRVFVPHLGPSPRNSPRTPNFANRYLPMQLPILRTRSADQAHPGHGVVWTRNIMNYSILKVIWQVAESTPSVIRGKVPSIIAASTM